MAVKVYAVIYEELNDVWLGNVYKDYQGAKEELENAGYTEEGERYVKDLLDGNFLIKSTYATIEEKTLL